jgi:hypothetical protein
MTACRYWDCAAHMRQTSNLNLVMKSEILLGPQVIGEEGLKKLYGRLADQAFLWGALRKTSSWESAALQMHLFHMRDVCHKSWRIDCRVFWNTKRAFTQLNLSYCASSRCRGSHWLISIVHSHIAT